MERTVVAVFDELDDAQAVHDELVKAGVDEDHISIHCAGVGDFKNAAPFETPGGSDGWSGQRVGFLARLFGLEHDLEDALHLHEAVRRGSCVVTVNARDEEEARRAEAALERRGPVNLDERVADWRERGWVAGEESAPLSSDALEEERRYIAERERRRSETPASGTLPGHSAADAGPAAGKPVKVYVAGERAVEPPTRETDDPKGAPSSRRR